MIAAARQVLTFRNGPLRGQRLPVRRQIRVGRGDGNDVVLKDSALSRLHCCFYTQGATAYVADMDSTNGTRVNGETVLIRRALADGDVVTVGGVEIQYAE